MLFPGRIHIAGGPWHFGDFLPHLPKVSPSERGTFGTMPYSKSSPAGYCITFIKKVRCGPEVATFRTKPFNFTRIVHLNWLAKLNWGDPVPLVVNIIVNYCCTRVLLHAKILKEAETEEWRHFCHIFIIGGILIGGACPLLTGFAYGIASKFGTNKHLVISNCDPNC